MDPVFELCSGQILKQNFHFKYKWWFTARELCKVCSWMAQDLVIIMMVNCRAILLWHERVCIYITYMPKENRTAIHQPHVFYCFRMLALSLHQLDFYLQAIEFTLIMSLKEKILVVSSMRERVRDHHDGQLQGNSPLARGRAHVYMNCMSYAYSWTHTWPACQRRITLLFTKHISCLGSLNGCFMRHKSDFYLYTNELTLEMRYSKNWQHMLKAWSMDFLSCTRLLDNENLCCFSYQNAVMVPVVFMHAGERELVGAMVLIFSISISYIP